MARMAFDALGGGPAGPAVRVAAGGATGELGEGDEALLGYVELAPQAPVRRLSEVRGLTAAALAVLGRDRDGTGFSPPVLGVLCSAQACSQACALPRPVAVT